MAIRYAVQNGNWSDTLTWDGQTTIPTSSDDVYANTYTITIDGSFTVLTIRNTSNTNIIAGGTFSPNNSSNLTCTSSQGVVALSQACYTCNLTSGQTCTLNANIIGGNTTQGAVRNINSGELIINGSSEGNRNYSSGSAPGTSNTSSGTITITGDAIAAQDNRSSCHGVQNSGSGVINIIGNCIPSNGLGANASYAVLNSGVGTINITGTVNGANGTSTHGVVNSGTGTINITGTCSSIGNNIGAVNSSTGNLNITGLCLGGSSTGNGVVNNSSGILTHVGNIQASGTAPGMGVGSTSQQTFLTGPFIGHPNGLQANIAAAWRWNLSAIATYMEVYSIDPNNLLIDYKRTLYTADSVGGNPDVADTRSGVIFGPVGELTGTMVVPDPSVVRRGVPVDNTIGTAAITAAELWEYPLSSMTVPGSIGARLRQALTTPLLGKYLEAYGTYGASEVPPAP